MQKSSTLAITLQEPSRFYIDIYIPYEVIT